MTSIANMLVSSHTIDLVPRAKGGAGAATLWLRLAAAPTFGVMALLTFMDAGQMPVICGAGPLTGMVSMYALMSIFHTPAWLKLIANRRIIHDNKRKG